jgi:hypothetical protein
VELPPETCRTIYGNKQIEKTLHLVGCTSEINGYSQKLPASKRREEDEAGILRLGISNI